MTEELIIDSFAGGGGASLGISWALGRCPDVAINHDSAAIAMHAANHPATKHYVEDVWRVSPLEVTAGKSVGLLWASPDCKHFSRAKGGKPVEKKIRSLAWVVVKWAIESRPRLIILENVREFEQWGPLIPMWACGDCGWKGTDGQVSLSRKRRACPRCDSISLEKTDELVPDPDRSGLTFKRFVGRLRAAGYRVEWQVLNAADFGAPTHRRRLFLIARSDGERIVWPQPTHGDPKRIGRGLYDREMKPWRVAAECIDWDLPCPSIFGRSRPLAEATMRRIAFGIKRYVLENPRPFIVGVGGRMGQTAPSPVDQPNNTMTQSKSNAVIAPCLAKIGHTVANGGYVNSAKDPLTTITSKNQHIAVAAFLHRYYGNSVGQAVDQPSPTESKNGHSSIVTASIIKHFGGVVGVPVDTPLPTTTERGTQNQLLAANLVHMNHGGKQWSGLDDPMYTVMSGGTHAALVYSFLVKYFGTGAVAAIAKEKGRKVLMLTGVRIGESAARDQRIALSCSKNGAECGQGWFQEALSNQIIDTLAPIVHWRVCHVWAWLRYWAPDWRHGEWPTEVLAEAYGGDEAEEINARTGCVGCPLASKDTALDAIIRNPKWSYLSPLKGLREIYREMREPKYRLRKPGGECRKDGTLALNQQRLGPLTLDARERFLNEILLIQHNCNLDAHRSASPFVDILNDDEVGRIRELIAAQTWPDGWTGDEPTGDALTKILRRRKRSTAPLSG